MEKRMLWIALALLLMSCSSSATNVSVTVVKDTVLVGETVELVLEVEPSESVGGEFVIREWVNETYGSFVRRLFSKPFPWTCSSCSGIPGTPLKEHYKAVFHFIPTKAGSYNAEAYFRGTATTARDGRNFTVMESSTTTTTTTTTTLPKTLLCSGGGIGVTDTSEDTQDALKLRHKNPEYRPGGTYYPKMDTTEDEIHLSGFERKSFNVTFYIPEGLNTASIYVKAGAEDGLALETNFTINGIVIGGCTITGDMTDGVSGRWGECTAELDASNLTRKTENTLTVVNNLVPDMFKLSYADYDYMELRCNESGGKTTTTRRGTTTTTTTLACVDSDGQDYYAKGGCTAYSTGGNKTIYDFCTSANAVVEFICHPASGGTACIGDTHACDFGCSEGACKAANTTTTVKSAITTTTMQERQEDGKDNSTIMYAAALVVSLAAFAVLIMKARKEK
jgi:hypothetical protein